MTAADLISDLHNRGVELVAEGDKLRFRPADRLTSTDLVHLRHHKPEILRRLRLEAINRFADLRPTTACDRCGSTDFVDVPIHGGRSIRRDCERCDHFKGWSMWYGRTQGQKN